jgi:hypothetical protein
MNRQPTLVQESMLGMRIRIGPNFSFGASCGPIEALRGDYVPVCFFFWRKKMDRVRTEMKSTCIYRKGIVSSYILVH